MPKWSPREFLGRSLCPKAVRGGVVWVPKSVLESVFWCFSAAGVLLGGPIGHACRALSSSGMPNWSPGGFLGRSGGLKAVRGEIVLVPKPVSGSVFWSLSAAGVIVVYRARTLGCAGRHSDVNVRSLGFWFRVHLARTGFHSHIPCLYFRVRWAS